MQAPVSNANAPRSRPTLRPKAYICELCVDMCASIHKRTLINRITELEMMVDEMVKAVNAEPTPPVTEPTAAVQPQATAEMKQEREP